MYLYDWKEDGMKRRLMEREWQLLQPNWTFLSKDFDSYALPNYSSILSYLLINSLIELANLSNHASLKIEGGSNEKKRDEEKLTTILF